MYSLSFVFLHAPIFFHCILDLSLVFLDYRFGLFFVGLLFTWTSWLPSVIYVFSVPLLVSLVTLTFAVPVVLCPVFFTNNITPSSVAHMSLKVCYR